MNECWLAPAIYLNLSSPIMSWTFRILAHEEDQYTDFLSIALKQTKARPRSSGTPFQDNLQQYQAI